MIPSTKLRALCGAPRPRPLAMCSIACHLSAFRCELPTRLDMSRRRSPYCVFEGSFTMFATLLLLLSLLLIPAIVVSLSINPAQIIPTRPSNASQLHLPNASLPALVPLPSHLSDLMLQCDPEKYGHGLRYSSCHDAYLQIPHLIAVISFGPRTQGNWAVSLPFRAYSCKWQYHFILVTTCSRNYVSSKSR